jgi:hypothetical protein
MRCYFMRAGHIAGVEILEGLTGEEEKSRSLFAERANEYDGAEVWEGARMVLQHPRVEPKTDQAPG